MAYTQSHHPQVARKVERHSGLLHNMHLPLLVPLPPLEDIPQDLCRDRPQLATDNQGSKVDKHMSHRLKADKRAGDKEVHLAPAQQDNTADIVNSRVAVEAVVKELVCLVFRGAVLVPLVQQAREHTAAAAVGSTGPCIRVH